MSEGKKNSVRFQLWSFILLKSGSRGIVLSRVAKSIPDASTLLHKLSGGSSKRVYILLKNDDKDGGTKTFGI